MTRAPILHLSATTISALCLGTMIGAQTGPQPVRIHIVDHPRPVSEAARGVEKQFGYVVTYEDTRYVDPDDIVDITKQTSRDPSKTTGILGRKPGSLDVMLTPRAGLDEGQEVKAGEVLHAVVEQANAEGMFGQFRVDRVPGAFHIVPVAIKGKTGVMEPYASPLDARITMARREERAFDAIRRLGDALTAASGITVQPGTMPTNLMIQRRVAAWAGDERARDVLLRVLRAVRPDLSWQLLCDVGERGFCALNIHIVQPN
jgi:hypothetical protein